MSVVQMYADLVVHVYAHHFLKLLVTVKYPLFPGKGMPSLSQSGWMYTIHAVLI